MMHCCWGIQDFISYLHDEVVHEVDIRIEHDQVMYVQCLPIHLKAIKIKSKCWQNNSEYRMDQRHQVRVVHVVKIRSYFVDITWGRRNLLAYHT